METQAAETNRISGEQAPLVEVAPSSSMEWVGEFDVLRLFGALAVVLIHVIARAVREVALDPHSPATVITLLMHFAVPAFVMMAAGLAWSRDPKQGWGSFFRRRGASVGIPYIFWWLFYLAFVSVVQWRLLPARDMLTGLVTGKPSYHLYFIPIVLFMYALTPVLRPLIRRSPEAAFALLSAIWWAGGQWDGRLPFTDVRMHGMSVVRPSLDLLLAAAIGMWYLSRRQVFRRILGKIWPLLLVIGFASAPAAALDFAWPTLPRFVGVFAQLTGLLGACSLIARGLESSERLKKISALTFGVYLIHPFVIWVSVRYAVAAGYPHVVRIWWTALLLWFLVSPLCFALVAGVRRFAVGRAIT